MLIRRSQIMRERQNLSGPTLCDGLVFGEQNGQRDGDNDKCNTGARQRKVIAMNAFARCVGFSSACERASLTIVLKVASVPCVSVKCPRARGCPRPPQCGQTDGFVRLDDGLVFPDEMPRSEFFEFSRARFKGKSGRLKAPKAELVFLLVAEQRFSNVIRVADQDMMFEIVNAVDAGD